MSCAPGWTYHNRTCNRSIRGCRAGMYHVRCTLRTCSDKMYFGRPHQTAWTPVYWYRPFRQIHFETDRHDTNIFASTKQRSHWTKHILHSHTIADMCLPLACEDQRNACNARPKLIAQTHSLAPTRADSGATPVGQTQERLTVVNSLDHVQQLQRLVVHL